MLMNSMLKSVACEVKIEKQKTFVKLFRTDIISFDSKHIKLNVIEPGTGKEWFTYTTKRRMNEFSRMFKLGFRVSQHKFKWFVNYKGVNTPYINGMVLFRK